MKIYGLEGVVTMNEELEKTVDDENIEETNETEVDEEKVEPEVTSEIEVEQPGNIEAIVEGLLYVVGEDGVKIEQIAIAINKSVEDTKTIIENIQRKYASELYGIELVGYGSVYKFITKKDVYPYAQELFGVTKPSTLSQSALETLAIIAYKQPITRVEIEELRGVNAEMMLRKLQARNLIREVGRSDAPGRPILYEVTEEFMDSFKLYTLNELPDLPKYEKEEEKELFE
jgi:segregation and condensation protein B